MTEPMRSVAWRDGRLRILDQTRLPACVEWLEPATLEELHAIIGRLAVRGADAIGIAAAYGLTLAAAEPVAGGDLRRHLAGRAAYLKGARPTAVHLAWAVDRVLASLAPDAYASAAVARDAILAEAGAIEREDREMCRRIGEHGAELLRGLGAVLTHCNAGWLGTAGYGTALAPFYVLKERGTPVAVYADESRPLLQGARLTTWELGQAGVEVTQIADGAAAYVMARGLVQAAIVGADRIARNGDTANKIGTYGVAILARHHGIPFYVAAPTSAFDPALAHGGAIPIEMRAPEELTHMAGTAVSAPGAKALNPAFDVTPAALVTAFVTDRGIVRPPYGERLAAAFGWDPPAAG